MAKQFPAIQEAHREFISKQKIFFTGSAAPSGRVNVSPKGLSTFRYINPNEVAYLDLTGSGNEAAAHIKASPENRLTIMFCSFEEVPLILRVYGQGSVHRPSSKTYKELSQHFDSLPGARQIIHLKIDLVQTSCGFGVPFFEYQGQRETLILSAEKKGPQVLNNYRKEKNQLSIDGFPTDIEISED